MAKPRTYIVHLLGDDRKTVLARGEFTLHLDAPISIHDAAELAKFVRTEHFNRTIAQAVLDAALADGRARFGWRDEDGRDQWVEPSELYGTFTF